jgi:homoserine O-acetyltransferase
MLRAKNLIDMDVYRVIVVDALGDGVSCSPSNSKAQHGVAFPRFSIRDMVEAEHQLMTRILGINHVHAVMGYSMGAMQSLQWAVSYPDFMDTVVAISGTPQLSKIDRLVTSEFVTAIEQEPAYRRGRYRHNPELPVLDLLLTIDFTTREERADHGKPAVLERHPVQQQAQGQSDDGGADANDILWQVYAIQQQDIGIPNDNGHRDDHSLARAIARIKAKMYIVHAEYDGMVDPRPAFDFAGAAQATVTRLPAYCGHSAIQCNADLVRDAIRKAL